MFNLINKNNYGRNILLILLIGGMFFIFSQKAYASMREDYPRYRLKAGTNNVANMLSSWTKAITSYESSKYDISANKFSTDLFGDNASKFRVKSQAKAMFGLESVKGTLKSQYANCNLTDKEILGILFYTKGTGVYLQEEIVETVPSAQWPTQADKEQGCNKLTICMLGKDQKMSNSACDDIIRTIYFDGVNMKERNYIIEESNLGSEKFYNGTLDDSIYDIFYDMGQISKILYEDAPSVTSTSVVFYKMPQFKGGSSNGGGSNTNGGNNNSSSNGGNSNGGKSTSSSVGGSNTNGGNNNSSSNGWNSNGGKSASSSVGGSNTNGGTTRGTNVIPNITDDPELNRIINGEVQDYKTVTNNGNTAYINKCMIVSGSPKLEEAYLAAEAEEKDGTQEIPSVFDDFTAEEIQELVDDIIKNSNKLEETSDKPLGKENQKEGNDVPGALGASTGADAIEDLRKQLNDCVSKCDGLRFDEKAICKAKCLCSEYTSKALPSNTEYQFLKEGALRIRICNIPSKPVVVSTSTKTVMSIDTILSEIHDTIKALFESGELTPKMKKQELLDTSMNNIKFSDVVSFNIGMQFKKAKADKEEKEEDKIELQKNLKADAVKDIDPQKGNSTDPSGREKTPPKTSIITENTTALIAENKYAGINKTIQDFLEKQRDFLKEITNVMDEMTRSVDGRMASGAK